MPTAFCTFQIYVMPTAFWTSQIYIMITSFCNLPICYSLATLLHKRYYWATDSAVKQTKSEI
jgi:hypothetical protein